MQILVGRNAPDRRMGKRATGVVAVWAVCLGQGFAQTTGEREKAPAATVPAGQSVETLFVDFLHYARLGRFALADAYANALLAHPDLEPVKLVELADRDPRALGTLLQLIKASSIGDSAARVVELLRQGEHERRHSTDRIQRNIQLLAGDPQQEFFGIQRLVESGEYAVPLMVHTMLDEDKEAIWPRVVYALPQIGKPAVGPLVQALATTDENVRLHVIYALGEIGYPQAIPYLRRIVSGDSAPEQVKTAAVHAVQRIAAHSGRSFAQRPEDGFYELGNAYYDEDDAVRADARLEKANVWYWDESLPGLRRIEVPTRIFGPVMAMRCGEDSLALRNDHVDAMALWLAANIRRESRLGLDVESGDPEETGEADPTRPAVFPRALYFTQAAGPAYAHRVLGRAVRDRDSAVALGAIEALRVTAGESSLIGTEDEKQPLVQAIQFPDLLVRIRAALALGAALPRSAFSGSSGVVPLLASALALTEREQLLVVDPDEANRNRVAGQLRNGQRDVIAAPSIFSALERARTEFHNLSGLFVATDAREPDVQEGLARFRSEAIYSKMPVIVLVKPQQAVIARQLAGVDPYVEATDAAAEAGDLVAAFERVRGQTGQNRLSRDEALSIALETAETLRRVVVDGRTVYDASVAEPALIAALSSSDERLATLAAFVLAILPTPTAQRAVAYVALKESNTKSLRDAAFASLAESAKSYGNLLDSNQIDGLVEVAGEDPDLTLRTSASQALGALNLTTTQASEILRSYSGNLP